MKRILTSIAFVLSCFFLHAQTAHMDFNGITMDGSLDSFCKALEAKGYASTDTEDEAEANIKNYSGEYNGDQVTVCVYGTPKTQTVYTILMYTTVDTEDAAKQKAASYVNLFKSKYNGQTDNGSGGTVYVITSSANIEVYYSKQDSGYTVAVGITDCANKTLNKQEEGNSGATDSQAEEESGSESDSDESSDEGGEEESEE